jgi:AcrR family transcriptional regulator
MRADARRNRDRVLEAARAVFAERGASASTEEIAAKAGVGIGTVFRHFPTKEVLLEAILLDRVAKISAEARRLTTAPDPGAALLALVKHMVEQGATKRMYINALADAGLDSLGSRVGQSTVGREMVDELGALLARAQVAGAIRHDIGVTELIALVVGVSRAAEYTAWDGGVLARTLEVVIDGLRARG